jgi:hypothetical protein
LLLERLSSGEFDVNQDKLIKDSVLRMKQRSLEKKRQSVLKALAKQEKEMANSEEMRNLISEKMYLDEELSKLKDEA